VSYRFPPPSDSSTASPEEATNSVVAKEPYQDGLEGDAAKCRARKFRPFQPEGAEGNMHQMNTDPDRAGPLFADWKESRHGSG
jgi:hypothetical protein